jgi:selenocysteine lyase/cysteine desulfurase
VTTAKAVYQTRTVLAKMFNAEPERVVFTKNCTEALNLAIFGTLKQGGHVITTTFEHNSVLRPLFHLERLGLITLSVVSPSAEKSLLQAIKEAFVEQTYLVVCTAVSNVTGEVLPVKDIAKLCKERKATFLVDGAQGAGHITLNLDDGINLLALASHKGLYGIMGSGALVFDKNTEISPFILGGTGVDTFNPFAPKDYPERLEAGTLNLPAILALKEGASYVMNNLDCFASHLISATNKLIVGLKDIEGVKVYSKPNPTGIVCFEIENLPSQDLADILSNEYDVAVRGGFHCAPKMHEYLNTSENGLLRVSIAVQNSSLELEYFLSAIKKIVDAKFS